MTDQTTITAAGVGKGARPRGLRPRLLILCGHEPTLDPRIDWAARAASQAGWDVRVHGFVIGEAKPKFSDPPEYSTSRGRPTGDPRARAALVRTAVAWRVLPRSLVMFAAGALRLGRLLSAAAQAVVSLARLPGAKAGRSPRTPGRPFETLNRWIDRVTDRLPDRLREGAACYSWYFRNLIIEQADAALRMFPKGAWKPDVIHANDPDSLLCAALLKTRFGARLVYDAHEYGPEAYIYETTPRALFFAYERALMRHVDAAVTVTPQIAAKFNRRYRDQPRFHVVPNACPTPEMLEPLDEPFVRATARGRVRVLFQGGFAENRGVEELIETWRSIDDQAAVLYLRGPESPFRDRLVDRARKTGRLGRSIFFLPSVPESQLVGSALNADVGVISYLSRVENHHGACPNKTAQYMQAGLMLVATELPFVKSVIEAAGAGVTFDDREAGGFERALNAAIHDAEMRKACQENARAYARAVFNYGRYFPILLALYGDREPPGDVAHTRLNEPDRVPVAPDLKAPPLPDRQAFESRFERRTPCADLDTSAGVFNSASLQDREAAQGRGLSAWSSPKTLEFRAAAGEVDALIELAGRHHRGEGVAIDAERALALYRQAADLGSVWARYMVGVMHQEGEGAPKSYADAVRWYRLAADSGHVLSMRNVGILYQVGGFGLTQDVAAAVAAYEQAAEFGDGVSAANGAALLQSHPSIEGAYRRRARLVGVALSAAHPHAEDMLERFVRDLGLSPYLDVNRKGAAHADALTEAG